jgi:hypothetical protein
VTKLELQLVVSGLLASTVVLGAVVSAAFGWTVVASVLSIYALGVGAWAYHAIERYVVSRRISTVRSAATPLKPLFPVMAAIMGLTQAVVRALTDVTDTPPPRRELPVWRWVEITRGGRRYRNRDDDIDIEE